MVLSDLSLSQSASSDTVKSALEAKLREVLPAGSFNIILRSYQGDFRARSSGQVAYNAMILLDKSGRQAALTHKQEIEAMGFKVSASGDISAN